MHACMCVCVCVCVCVRVRVRARAFVRVRACVLKYADMRDSFDFMQRRKNSVVLYHFE